MKTLLAASLVLTAAVPAVAQTGAAPPAPASAANPASLTLDSPIESLIAHPGAKAVVLATLPDIESAPGYDQFKALSLRRLQPHSGGKITDENMAAIEAGLKALPKN